MARRARDTGNRNLPEPQPRPRRRAAKAAQSVAAAGDVAALLTAADVATISLDRALRLRRFTPAVAGLLNVSDADVGRPIADIARTFSADLLLEDARRVLAGLAPASAEVRADDGRWYQRRILPSRADDGSIGGVVVTFVDVTELKGLAEALRESDERARELASFPEDNPNPVLRVSADGSVLYQNRAASEWHGREVSTGEPATEPFVALAARAIAEGRQAQTEVAFAGRTFLAWAVPFREQGYANVYARDITDRKEAEQELQRARNLLAEAEKVAHLGSFEYVVATQTTVWSEEEYRIFGLDPGAPSPTYDEAFATYIHPDDVVLVRETFAACAKARSVFECEHRIVRTDGSVRWVYHRAHPHFDERATLVRYVGATLDITERKEAEEALRESEARLRLAQHAAKAGTWEWDLVTNRNTWSDELWPLYGLAAHSCEPSYEAWLQSIHPDDRERAARAVREAAAAGAELTAEWRVADPAGAERWLMSRGQPQLDDAGRVVRYLGIVLDITALKRAEEDLRRQGAVLAAINRVLELGLGPQTEEQLCQACLGVIEEVTGSKISFIAEIGADGVLDELAISNPGWAACAIESAGGHRRLPGSFPIHGIYGRVFADGRSLIANDPESHPDRIGMPEGHPPLTSFLGVPLLREGRMVGMIAVGNRPGGYRAENQEVLEAIAVAVVEALDRKRAEEALARANDELERRVAERTAELARRARQLRALAGELTLSEQRERTRLARVLHDHLQQMLVAAKFRTAIVGRGGDQVLREATKEIEALIDECLAAARSLTAELSPPVLQEAGLGAGLEWLARRMADRHGLLVDLELEQIQPLPGDLKILLFETVRELLFNVVKHAQTRSAVVSMRRVDGSLQLTVSDQGVGFDPEVLSRAGDPGKGFGLFSVRERLELFGGSLEIQSSPGRGSRIFVVAPLPDVAPVPPAGDGVAVLAELPVPEPPAAPGTGRRIRILLADDHAVVRRGLAQMLGNEADMEVVGEAADGQEAVEMARALLPDLIVMDVSMPRLNGVEATRIIANELPEIRVIGLSMFEEAERAQAMRDAGAVHYMTKSRAAEDLVASIRTHAARTDPRT